MNTDGFFLLQQVTDIFNNNEKFFCMKRDIDNVDLNSFEDHAFYATAESKGADIEMNAECKCWGIHVLIVVINSDGRYSAKEIERFISAKK